MRKWSLRQRKLVPEDMLVQRCDALSASHRMIQLIIEGPTE